MYGQGREGAARGFQLFSLNHEGNTFRLHHCRVQIYVPSVKSELKAGALLKSPHNSVESLQLTDSVMFPETSAKLSVSVEMHS